MKRITAILLATCIILHGQSELPREQRAKIADKELNYLYSSLMKRLNNDERSQLTNAQRTWIAFRDSESVISSKINHADIDDIMLSLTNERVKELRSFFETISSDQPSQTQVPKSQKILKALPSYESHADDSAVEMSPRERNSLMGNSETSNPDLDLASRFDSAIEKSIELYKFQKYEEAKIELLKLNTSSFHETHRGIAYGDQIKGLLGMINQRLEAQTPKPTSTPPTEPKRAHTALNNDSDERAVMETMSSLTKMAQLQLEANRMESERRAKLTQEEKEREDALRSQQLQMLGDAGKAMIGQLNNISEVAKRSEEGTQRELERRSKLSPEERAREDAVYLESQKIELEKIKSSQPNR